MSCNSYLKHYMSAGPHERIRFACLYALKNIYKPDAPLPFFRKQAIGDKSRILGFIVFEPVIGNLAFFID